MMDFAPPTVTVGNDILDIGSRKARRQRGDPMEMIPHAGAMMGAPGQFDLPAVANVRLTVVDSCVLECSDLPPFIIFDDR